MIVDNPTIEDSSSSLNGEIEINSLQDLHGKINNFQNPAEMWAFFNPDILKGKTAFHPWQAQVNKELGESFAKASEKSPYELSLCAVNGSGKDMMVISLFAVFTIFQQQDSYVVVTSASANQLDSQTGTYISRVCEKINAYYGLSIFHITERSIKCNLTGGELLLFRSDEEGKTEGHHPRIPGGVFVIIINEAKSVEDKIFEALLRCNGYTHWIEVSSPGRPDGHFFRYHTGNRAGVNRITVTGDMCPHLNAYHFKRVAEDVGENSALYRSMRYAEFSSVDEQVVIGYEIYNRCIKYPPAHYPDPLGNTAGLDLSGGGDEIVLSIRNGNKLLAQHFTRQSDLKVRGEWLSNLFSQYNLKSRPIYADAGGLGAEVIKYLHMLGWTNIIGIYNQSSAEKYDQFKNLGTESWYKLKRLIEDQLIILIDEEILRKQLCNRYYKFMDSSNVAQLESKQQARAKGHPSPDRADSLVLCFMDYQYEVVKSKKESTTPQLSGRQTGQRRSKLEAPSIAMFVKNLIKPSYNTKGGKDHKWIRKELNTFNKDYANTIHRKTENVA